MFIQRIFLNKFKKGVVIFKKMFYHSINAMTEKSRIIFSLLQRNVPMAESTYKPLIQSSLASSRAEKFSRLYRCAPLYAKRVFALYLSEQKFGWYHGNFLSFRPLDFLKSRTKAFLFCPKVRKEEENETAAFKH